MEACLAKEHFQLIVPQLKKYMIVSLIGITRYEMRNDTVCVIESDYAMGVYLTNLMMDRLTFPASSAARISLGNLLYAHIANVETILPSIPL